MAKQGKIHVGIGGWTFEPWRGTFYPDKLPQKRELEYASGRLTSIEINGTYYGSQKPESFARWHDETPEGFVFALKGPRFATNRKQLAQSRESVERFLSSGLLELKDKLGPINWQFMETKKFEPEDFESFLGFLPASIEGRPLKHAVEVRHASFAAPDFIALARRHGVAVITAGDSKFPQIADPTADFVYLRIMGTDDRHDRGYSEAELDVWAERARAYAGGGAPGDLDRASGDPAAKTPRDVYLYVISGHKERNPAAAMALIERLR
ncbi:MAG: DUF72 domain-containing protein [Rhizobiaceae bacterium]|nr:DUF72 domain-containing protein [Rhizobiaceae bacterium]